MSQSKDRHEAERWFATADEDLCAALALQAVGMYAHACFIAQQCGEKALKAMWRLIGEEPWGHSIQKLVAQFPRKECLPNWEATLQDAAALDRFYISTRYPNGLPDLTPGQSYFLRDAEQAIGQARSLLEISRHFLARKDDER
jgi:HEPN domain-containing protein